MPTSFSSRLASLVTFCVLAILVADRAQAKDPPASPETWQLAFQFTPDQTLHYKDHYHSTIRVQKADYSLRVLNKRNSRKHFKILSVDDDGRGLVETTIDRVKITVTKGDEPPIRVDSTADPDECPRDFRPFLKTIGEPIARTRFRTSGEMVKVLSVSRNWLEAHPGSTIESMSNLMENRSFLARLPSQPVAIGATWSEEFMLKVADPSTGARKINLRRIYELKAVKDDRATISWKTTRLTPVVDRRILAQLIQCLSTGTIVFDLQRGILISRTIRVTSTLIAPFGDNTLMSADTTHELVLSEGD